MQAQLADSQRAMGRLLECETEEIVRLGQLLQQEYSALKTNNLAGIESAAYAKQQPLARLETYEQQRNEVLQRANLSSDEIGMQLYLQSADAGIKRLWQQLLTLTAQCRQQNQINAALVELSRRHTQRVLTLLRGQTDHQTLYGPAGETAVDGRSQTLVSA